MTLTLPMCFVCQMLFSYIYIYVFIYDLTGQTSLCTHTAFRLPCPALTSQISLCKSHPFTLKHARVRTFSDIWSFWNKSPTAACVAHFVICSDRTLPFWKNFTFAAGYSVGKALQGVTWRDWQNKHDSSKVIRILRATKACVKAMAERVPLSSSEPDFIWFDIYDFIRFHCISDSQIVFHLAFAQLGLSSWRCTSCKASLWLKGQSSTSFLAEPQKNNQITRITNPITNSITNQVI